MVTNYQLLSPFEIMLYKKIFRALLLRRQLLIFMPILSAVTVTVFTFFMEKNYISSSRLLLNLKDQKISLISQGVQQYEIETQFDNLFELLKSRLVIDQVRLRMLSDGMGELHDYIEMDDEFEELQQQKEEIKVYTQGLYKHNMLLDARNEYDNRILELLDNNDLKYEDMMTMITVYRIGTSNFIGVTANTQDPVKSTYILELLLEEVIEAEREIASAKYKAKRLQTEELVLKAKQDMVLKEKDLEMFKVKNNIINLSEYTRTIVNQIVDMEIQLIHLKEAYYSHKKSVTELEKAIGKSELKKVNNDSGETADLLNLKDSLQAVNEKIFYHKLTTKNKEKVKELEAEAERLRERISTGLVSTSQNRETTASPVNQDLRQKYFEHKIEMDMSHALIPLVKGELNRLKSYAKDFAPLESTLLVLNRDVKLAQEKYLQLKQKLQTATLAEQEAGEEDIIIVDAPLPPEKPEKGKKVLMVIGSFVATLIILIASIVVAQIYGYYRADIKELMQ